MLSKNPRYSSYNEIAEDMIPSNKPCVFVEGNNKLFYQNIAEFVNCFVRSGGSSNSIKEKISGKLQDGKNNFIGIIDKDYFDHKRDLNIFILDFYSIENVSLKFMPQFTSLRIQLTSFFNDNELKNIQMFKLIGCGGFDKDKKKPEPFILNFSNAYDISLQSYVESNIISLDSFFKYKNLKKTVENYVIYYKICNGKKEEIKHLEHLSEYLPDQSSINLFDRNMYNILDNTLQNIYIS